MASIFSRKRDLLYLMFFLIHIPVLFFVDFYTLYPEQVRPAFMQDLRKWYIATYRDQNFISPTAWFNLYIWLEFFYHLPLSFWAVGALLRNDPKVPIHLLAYSIQTAVTTATCIAEYMSWTGYSSSEKLELGKLYVPYLALSVFMGVDMFGRLNAAVERTTNRAKKQQ